MAIFVGSKYTYLVVFTANIIAFITGTSIVWSSPILAILKDDDLSRNPFGRKITSSEESWIGSLAALGGIFGPVVFSNLIQWVGRKTTIAAVSVPYLVGYLIAAFAETVPLFYVARILMGMGVGGMFSILPIYVSEVAEDRNRGILQGSATTYIMLGILLSYCIGPFVSIMAFNLILSALCVLFVPVFWFIAPESPYRLVTEGKEEEAFKALHYLRRKSDKETRKDLEEIKNHINQLKPGSFSEIFKTKGTLKGFLYSLALTTFQQFSGITVILYYTQNIFHAAGSDLAPEYCSIIVGSAQLLVAVFSPLFLDKAGRRLMLLIAVTGSLVAEVLLGVYFYLQKDGTDVSNLSWLPIFSLVMFIVFYNMGMGSIPWATMAELLPLNIIAKASMLVTGFYWVTGFFLTLYFADLSDGVGMAGSFWLFAGFCVVYDLFVIFIMFETKGKSLVEIQEILNR